MIGLNLHLIHICTFEVTWLKLIEPETNPIQYVLLIA